MDFNPVLLCCWHFFDPLVTLWFKFYYGYISYLWVFLYILNTFLVKLTTHSHIFFDAAKPWYFGDVYNVKLYFNPQFEVSPPFLTIFFRLQLWLILALVTWKWVTGLQTSQNHMVLLDHWSVGIDQSTMSEPNVLEFLMAFLYKLK